MTLPHRCKTSLFAVLGLAVGTLVATGCQDSSLVDSPQEGEPVAAEATDLSKRAHGGSPMSATTILRARLRPVGSSGVTGEATVQVNGDRLAVSVNSKDLKASVEHAQHFHANGSCDNFGPPVVSLDDDIANEPRDATNADEGDDSFPTATPGGTLNYWETASKSAVADSLGEALDLENRTVIVHAAGTPIGPPAACGELDPVGR